MASSTPATSSRRSPQSWAEAAAADPTWPAGGTQPENIDKALAKVRIY